MAVLKRITQLRNCHSWARPTFLWTCPTLTYFRKKCSNIQFWISRVRAPYFTTAPTILFITVQFSLKKQPTLRNATTGFPAKSGRLRNERTNSILMTRHYPDRLSHEGNLLQPIRKHYPDLGCDTSSVWNLCARFSDVNSRANSWWCRKMSAVFSDYV